MAGKTERAFAETDSDRDAKGITKKSAKPSNFDNLTNQRPATKILTNGITWREIHFEFWTNQI